MRITIEVDRHTDPCDAPTPPPSGQPVTPAATFDVPDGGTYRAPLEASPLSDALDAGAAADPEPEADLDVPADLLARATALNARSAGRAPDLSALARDDPGESRMSHAPSTTGTPTGTSQSSACSLTSCGFDGITDAGGPAPGLGADAP